MENSTLIDTTMDQRLADRLRTLRQERGWSLDDLAHRSGISRATLSRLENAAVSATTAVLGKLCSVHGMTLSRLMYLVEQEFTPVIREGDQAEWADPSSGLTRRVVSPPSEGLTGEVLNCRLEAGRRITYETSPRPGLEHHLLMVEGELTVTIEGTERALAAGDCLRYRLHGDSIFTTPPDQSAHYLLFIL